MSEETKTETQDKGLDNFEWSENGNFFNIEGTAVETEDKTKEVVEEVKKEQEPPKEKDEDNASFFGQVEEESKKEEPKAKEEGGVEDEEEEGSEDNGEKQKAEPKLSEEELAAKEEEDKKFFTTLAGEMQERGVFSNIELEEDAEINEDTFFELQEREVDARVDETFKGFFEQLDPDAAAFLKFKKEGGNTRDFFRVYAQVEETPSFDDADLDNEENQDRLISYYAKAVEGMDDDEVRDKLEFLAEKNSKKAYAEKYNKKLQEFNQANKEQLQEQAELAKKQQEEQRETFVNDMKDTLEEMEDVNGITLDKKEKADLHNFITKAAVKIGDNRYITGIQAAVSEAFRDKDKLIKLAKVLKDDFDFSGIEAKAKTKQTKKIKSNLNDIKRTQKPSGSSSRQEKQLSDFF